MTQLNKKYQAQNPHHNHVPLPPLRKFLYHLFLSILCGLFFIFVVLMIGMIGYHEFEGESWVDAFVNAAMILSGMGPLKPLQTTSGKIFAGFYALFSGLVFLVIIGVILAPVLHRFFHKIHLDIKL